MPHQTTLNYLLLAIVIGGLMLLRMRRMSRGQRLRLERLWILPTVLVVGAVAALVRFPPHSADWPWLAAALLAGAGFGWARGSLMTITVDPDTHALDTRASPAAIVLLLAVFALRFGLRAALAQNAGAWHVGAALLTDAFIVFAVGLLSVQRVEMAIRARRLLAAARLARRAGAVEVTPTG